MITTGAGLLEIAACHGCLGLLAGLALAGVGQGLFTPANNAGIVRAAPRGRSGLISAVINMTRSIGTALGVALASLLYADGHRVRSGHGPQSAVSPGEGITVALGALGALALVAGVVLPLLPDSPGDADGGCQLRSRRGDRRGRHRAGHVGSSDARNGTRDT